MAATANNWNSSQAVLGRFNSGYHLSRIPAIGSKYYLTQFGKDVIATGLKLRELVIIPQLAFDRVK